jgi:hypothetical protein
MEVGFAFEPPYGAWHRAASDHGQGLEGGLGTPLNDPYR